MIRIKALPVIPYPWVVLALCVVASLAIALLVQGMGVLFPFIQEEFDTSRAQLGLIASGQIAGTIVTVLLAGWLADVIGVRRLWTASMIGVAVGILLFSQIQSVVQGILVGFLIGVAVSGTAPSNTKAIMDWVSRQRRGTALGVTEATIPGGSIIAAGLLTFLAVSFGWRTALIVMAITIAAAALLFVSFYRDKPGSYARADKTVKPASKLPQVLRNPTIWMATVVGTTVGPPQCIIGAYLVLYLREDLGMSAGEAGGLMAALMAGGAVGRVGWAAASDVLMKGRRVGILAMAGVLAVISMAVMALLPSGLPLPVVAALVFVVGIVLVGRSGVYVVFIAELAGPALSGTVMGFNATISALTSVTIVPIFGLIADQTESYAMSWWMLAAFSGFGLMTLAIVSSRIRSV